MSCIVVDGGHQSLALATKQLLDVVLEAGLDISAHCSWQQGWCTMSDFMDAATATSFGPRPRMTCDNFHEVSLVATRWSARIEHRAGEWVEYAPGSWYQPLKPCWVLQLRDARDEDNVCSCLGYSKISAGELIPARDAQYVYFKYLPQQVAVNLQLEGEGGTVRIVLTVRWDVGYRCEMSGPASPCRLPDCRG